ncbi:MAG: hypothetical protein DBX40_02350 [Clostridiales bacterium]|nr:MAG: hypothetical protein DBX40_02310 [Clostridiales bacterium]PWM27375.1 MAG: hypothetical protein DBX40_02330 [Clostridiales bacterium]PWM27379.1 MAG: hypothetical protein DBX40_02350 [Clostridiales bacterium]
MRVEILRRIKIRLKIQPEPLTDGHGTR